MNRFASQWHIPEVRVILCASFVNSVGTGLYLATYVVFAVASDVTAAQLSAGLSVGAVVSLLLAPLGAWAAERWGALRLTVILNLCRGVVAILLVFTESWQFAILLLVLTVLERLNVPAVQSVLGAVSGKGDRATILSTRQLTQTAGALAGAGIAAVFQLAVSGDRYLWVLLVGNGLSFIANAAMYRRLPPETAPPKKQIAPWTTGWPGTSTLVVLGCSVLLDAGGSVVALGFPLAITSESPELVKWIGALIAVETAIGVLVMLGVGRFVRSAVDAAAAVAIGSSASLGASLLLAMTGGEQIAWLFVGAVAFGFGATLVSFAVYFFIMETSTPANRERHMAAFGFAGTMQRIVAPWLLSALLIALAPSVGWTLLAALFAACGTVAVIASWRTARGIESQDVSVEEA